MIIFFFRSAWQKADRSWWETRCSRQNPPKTVINGVNIQIHTWHPGHFKLLSWITVLIKHPFPGSIWFFFFFYVAFCYITITANYSQRLSSERIPQCIGFSSSPSCLCPLLWLQCISLHSQTMPQYSQLKVNWSNAISTVILAETEHDRSALSRTHAYVLTHTFVSATRQKLELKGHVNHCSQTFCQWVTVVLKRAWGKTW